MNLVDYAKKNIKAYHTYKGSSKTMTLYFDVEKYTDESLGIPRTEMPQINWEDFLYALTPLKNKTKLSMGVSLAKDLKPTQGEINISKVIRNIIKGKEFNQGYTFIVDKDYRIIDGHHKHVQLLIQEPSCVVNYVRFEELSAPKVIDLLNNILYCPKVDLNDNIIESLLESYGQQPPSASVGMGAVELPKVSTSTAQAMNPDNRGSGDVPSPQKNKKYAEHKPANESRGVNRFYTSEYLKKLSKDTKKAITQHKQNINVLNLPLDENHPLASIMDLHL
ncbi:hypothetical protein HYO65_gp299 [Tenacibaculum phage PTm1]|uniref:Uncharacterized protein n=2 Tax=Shirahamavirus PTm1 TaxID=2846435 RepID=A0A5S9HXS5_9CAUD|nr:hypothetical protein HYO65_gp299 [Tenacibaculum phage PTm1]BBI90691.1 hypothetical protein [Tenacibaculum phage PTm1]BBI90998.1 hypothetical protein [Tenacibaculum phage PTm5]